MNMKSVDPMDNHVVLKVKPATNKAVATPTPAGIEIVHASLHQAVAWNGYIGSERTLSEKKVPGLKMYWTPQGLLLEMKGKKALIPTANIAIAQLADESDA